MPTYALPTVCAGRPSHTITYNFLEVHSLKASSQWYPVKLPIKVDTAAFPPNTSSPDMCTYCCTRISSRDLYRCQKIVFCDLV